MAEDEVRASHKCKIHFAALPYGTAIVQCRNWDEAGNTKRSALWKFDLI